jgi:hypothetical protein
LVDRSDQGRLCRQDETVRGAGPARQVGRFQHHALIVQGVRRAQVLAARCRFGADQERECQQNLPRGSARGSSKAMHDRLPSVEAAYHGPS